MQQSSEFDYKRYLQLLNRRTGLFMFLALLIMTIMVAVSYLLPKKYEAKSTVFIEKNVISELVKGITVTPSMEDTIKVLTYAITSRTILTKVVDSLDVNVVKNTSADSEGLIKSLQQRVKVNVRDKNLFIISFIDENPRVSRDFVNTLVRLYIEENTSSKRDESYAATQFLSEQIDTFRTKLEKAETAVNNFRRDKGNIIAVDEGRLFEEISLAQQKLYDLELRRHQLEGMRKITKISNDPLQTKLNVLQKRLSDLRSEYMESYPEVLKVKGEIEAVKDQMKTSGGVTKEIDPQELAKIESEIAAIKISEEGQRRFVTSNQALLREIPTARSDLEKLELERKNQKDIYDQLFARHGQSEVSKQMEVQDKSTTFRIVDPAILPVKPVSPNRLMIMLMGFVGGIAGALGFLLLLDQMDTSVKNVDSMKEFNVPLLAIIPSIPDPRVLEISRRKSMRLFSVAGVYFLLLLCFPLMELLGMTYVDRLVDKINPTGMVQDVKGRLK
ncbi:MAG: GNVR domain-containing protein [Desulfuromonadaceae bacterium]|nr:GNVR domain-containing protein [Desulfuromonadaceae bacterium]MDD5104844.1 GNVR domain-containing protein [Desulfuromonadaceae bacterium]